MSLLKTILKIEHLILNSTKTFFADMQRQELRKGGSVSRRFSDTHKLIRSAQRHRPVKQRGLAGLDIKSSKTKPKGLACDK